MPRVELKFIDDNGNEQIIKGEGVMAAIIDSTGIKLVSQELDVQQACYALKCLDVEVTKAMNGGI